MRASPLVLLGLMEACAVVPDALLPVPCADVPEDPLTPGDENCDGVEEVDASVLEAWRPDLLAADEGFVDLFTYETGDGEVIGLATSEGMLGLRFVERSVQACVTSPSILRGSGGRNFVALAITSADPTAEDALMVLSTIPLSGDDCVGIDPARPTQDLVSPLHVDELVASGDLLVAQGMVDAIPQLMAWSVGASVGQLATPGPACSNRGPARALAAVDLDADEKGRPELIRLGPVDPQQDALELFDNPAITEPGALVMCSEFPGVSDSLPVDLGTDPVLAAAAGRVIVGSAVEIWDLPWTELWDVGLPETPTWTGAAVAQVVPIDGGMVLLHAQGGATRIRGEEHAVLVSDTPLADAVAIDGDVILALEDGTLLRWP